MSVAFQGMSCSVGFLCANNEGEKYSFGGWSGLSEYAELKSVEVMNIIKSAASMWYLYSASNLKIGFLRIKTTVAFSIVFCDVKKWRKMY